MQESPEWNSDFNASKLFSSDTLQEKENDEVFHENSVTYQSFLSPKFRVVDEIASDRAVANTEIQTSPQKQSKKKTKKATQSKSRTKVSPKKINERPTVAPIIEQVPNIDSSPQLQQKLQENIALSSVQHEALPRATVEINGQQNKKNSDLDAEFSLQSNDTNKEDEGEKDNLESKLTDAIPANLDRILEPDTTTSTQLAPTGEISDRQLTSPDDTPSNVKQNVEAPQFVGNRIPSSPANDSFSSLENIPQSASLASAPRAENISAQAAQSVPPAVPTLLNSDLEITPVQTKTTIPSAPLPELQHSEPTVPDSTPVAQKAIYPGIAQQSVEAPLIVSDRNFTTPEDIPARQIVQPNSLHPSGETDSLASPTPIHSEQISTVIPNSLPIEPTTIAPLEAEVSIPQVEESSDLYSGENTPHFQLVERENAQELQQPDEQKISSALDNTGTANLTTEQLPQNFPKIPLQPSLNKERTEVSTPLKTQNLEELPALQVGQDRISDRELTLDPARSTQEVSDPDTETGVEAPLVVRDRHFLTPENLSNEISSDRVQKEPEQKELEQKELEQQEPEWKTEFETSEISSDSVQQKSEQQEPEWKTEFETAELFLSEVPESESHEASDRNSIRSKDLFSYSVDALEEPTQQSDLVNPTSQTSSSKNKTREDTKKTTQFKSTTSNTTAHKTVSNLTQQVPIIDSTTQARSQLPANGDFSPAQPEELLEATTEVEESRQQDNLQSDLDLASAVEPSDINKGDEAEKDALESQIADIIPASPDRILEFEPTTPVQLAPTNEISGRELTVIDNTPTSGKVAIPNNIEPSVEVENTSPGMVEQSVDPIATQQSPTDISSAAGDRNLSISHPAAPATSFEDTTSARSDISAESESVFLFEQVPPQGLAIGGEVPAATNLSRKPIAPSDTVPAMLTPGEFVVNATDAQKHLDLLQHINQGNSVENLPKSTTKVESSDAPVNPSLTPKHLVQRQTHTSLPGVVKTLVSPTLQSATEAQPASALNPLQSDRWETPQNSPYLPKTHYTATELIFRKPNNYNSSAPTTAIPDRWSSVEDLLLSNVATDNSYASTSKKIHHQDSATVSTPETSRQMTVKSFVQPKGFDKGGEVSADSFTPAAAVTHTIEMPAASATKANPNVLEMLAREIYQRLRQRLELERERHGFYSGRLPW
ncbi:hypothetical protein B7486_38985 [cyanobacterium TDX16]|nr:hypothetical protein B7486_38985 [cyanobacterium TDX16]